MVAAELFSFPLLIAAAVLGLTTWLLFRGKKRLPPGPVGLPFIGYHPFLSNDPYKDFMEMSAKYGPVVSYRSLGGTLVVVLNGAKTIKEVMVNRADEFLGRKGFNLVDWISDGVGMTQEEGDAWKEQRRFFLSTAKNYGFGKLELEDRMHDEYRAMLQDLRETKGRDSDLQFHIAYANNCIISHLLFSKRFGKDEFYKNLLVGLKNVVNLFLGKRHIVVGLMLRLDLMMAPEMKEATKSKAMFKKLTAEIVKEHMKNLDPANPKDYVDEYLVHMQKLIKSGNRGTFTTERLEANALNLFLEGTMSVSYTIANLLDKLSHHEDAQLKIQEELDEVVGKERLPSWADRTKLPLLEATIQELFRHRAPFWLSTMYSNFEETTINGYCIPKRSQIVYNIGSIHFDPKIYPDPEKFKPDRFLDANGKRVTHDGPVPFGLGKRACIGEALGQMEVFLVIGSILQHFIVKPGDMPNTHKLIPRKT